MAYVDTYRLDTYRFYPTRMAARIIDTIIGAIEMALGLRLVLLFLGANPAAGFVAWLYSVTDSLMQPFIGMFPAWSLGGGFILDLSTFAAMLAYGLLGWVILQIIYLLLPPGRIIDTRADI